MILLNVQRIQGMGDMIAEHAYTCMKDIYHIYLWFGVCHSILLLLK